MAGPCGELGIAVSLLMHAHKWVIGVCLGLIYAALHDSLSYSKTACQLPNGSNLKLLSILHPAPGSWRTALIELHELNPNSASLIILIIEYQTDIHTPTFHCYFLLLQKCTSATLPFSPPQLFLALRGWLELCIHTYRVKADVSFEGKGCITGWKRRNGQNQTFQVFLVSPFCSWLVRPWTLAPSFVFEMSFLLWELFFRDLYWDVHSATACLSPLACLSVSIIFWQISAQFYKDCGLNSP